ncbi:hypothetical protein [Sphingomonas sp. R1]|uniref:hypothetical protein n=1 Tax=Sphingomonas sp. R1 TaxID=399176 RepID=UPI002225957F|nr:hypothetical protein [Sphingomonas sp. R1]UYY77481.1 hypothetical protein OIM94_00260 [Sphingomonas sp. R1]
MAWISKPHRFKFRPTSPASEQMLWIAERPDVSGYRFRVVTVDERAFCTSKWMSFESMTKKILATPDDVWEVNVLIGPVQEALLWKLTWGGAA